MSVSSIPVMCYYNGHIVRTDNDVKYDGNKASIVPLEIPVDCTFEQLGDIIFASTPIDKRKFNLVLKCKYPLKCGNRFQPFTIWNDRSVHLMLNMVNTTVIEEIELFVEVVRIHRQENRSIGVAEIENLAEIDHGCGPSSGPVIQDHMEMMMVALMKKVMMNLLKMMMNMMMTYMPKPVDMYHLSRLQIRFWRMSEGYLSLRMHYIVMYRIL